MEAAYCICAMPLSILKTIPNDFAPRVKSAIEQVVYDSAYKIAWESRRFWEQDGDEIYGGISFLTTGPINLVWYPSAKLMSKRGVLISGYAVENWTEFGKLPSHEAKIAASRAAVEKLHPGKSKELEKPIYMSWGKVPYSLGSWVSRGPVFPAPADAPYFHGPYRELIVPDDRIYFAGDHCSHIIGWQEGAALAAQRTIAMIVSRMQTPRRGGRPRPPGGAKLRRLPECAKIQASCARPPGRGRPGLRGRCILQCVRRRRNTIPPTGCRP